MAATTARPVVIELGEGRVPPRLDRPAALSVRAHLPAATIALAATLLLATGSASPGQPAVVETRIPAALGDAMEIVGDRLYVIPPDPGFPDGRIRPVSAYQLPGGQRLWQTRLPVRGTVRNTFVGDATLLISAQAESTVQTVALDTGSGQVRWQRPYIAIGLSASGRRAVTVGGTPGPAPVPQPVEAVEVRTGQPVWSYAVPIDGWHYLSYGLPPATTAAEAAAAGLAGSGQAPAAVRSVVAQPTGHVVVRDLETGQVTAAGELGPRAGTSSPIPLPIFQVAGDLLLADWANDGRRMASAYDLVTLDLRWRQQLSLSTEYVSADCGGQLCVFAGSGGLRVLDQGTGQTRWSDPRWALAETLAGTLLVHAWQLPVPGSWSAVVDPLTGRVLLDLGRWITTRSAWAGGCRLDGCGGVGLPAVRLDSTAGRAWFGTVDLVSLAIRVLGSASDVSGDCRPGADWVVCRRANASIGVWTYRS
jgi:hypothetical protein